ncbi:MAG: VacJ family lipoprotein [Chthoniobacterales bacterium]
MKLQHLFPIVIAGLLLPVLSSCSTASSQKRQADAALVGTSQGDGKEEYADEDDFGNYDSATIADPLEFLNRGTFWVNHQLYRYLLGPISKTYETIVPRPIRKGLYNIFENIEYPVRLVNHTLQGEFTEAGQETGKFLVNSTIGIAGIMRPSDKIPALADVPNTDTTQTLKKWGIGHGIYIVLPLVGPSSVRDTVGFGGDIALNPVTWIGFFWGSWAWTIPVSAVDTLTVLPEKFEQYDAAEANSIDRYLALRSAYAQYSAQEASRTHSSSLDEPDTAGIDHSDKD